MLGLGLKAVPGEQRRGIRTDRSDEPVSGGVGSFHLILSHELCPERRMERWPDLRGTLVITTQPRSATIGIQSGSSFGRMSFTGERLANATSFRSRMSASPSPARSSSTKNHTSPSFGVCCCPLTRCAGAFENTSQPGRFLPYSARTNRRLLLCLRLHLSGRQSWQRGRCDP